MAKAAADQESREEWEFRKDEIKLVKDLLETNITCGLLTPPAYIGQVKVGLRKHEASYQMLQKKGKLSDAKRVQEWITIMKKEIAAAGKMASQQAPSAAEAMALNQAQGGGGAGPAALPAEDGLVSYMVLEAELAEAAAMVKQLGGHQADAAQEAVFRHGDLELKKKMLTDQIELGILSVETYKALLQAGLKAEEGNLRGDPERAALAARRIKLIKKELAAS
mmetsp:Transcript_46979/g.111467  ORF Transcript_46979/g.111467 Transcript_46979/m.111467 type:complete len:222 (+) Transcript_46979:76-741(+)